MIFNRFAKEARVCVEAAVEEAKMLGHDSIGDEDLLLGILHANEGVAAEALSSLGVTLEAAREESEAMLSEALSSVGISFEDIRQQAGDAFEMRIPEGRRSRSQPGRRMPRSRRTRRCGGWETTTSVPNTFFWEFSATETGRTSGSARLDVSAEALEERLYEVREAEG